MGKHLAIIMRLYDNGRWGYAKKIKSADYRGWYSVTTTSACPRAFAQRIPVELAFKIMKESGERFPDTRYCMEIVDG